ncbi:META domain-containing protein [Kaistella palustris]|uniref:META domain-containing protein n=1 Tax=Kaistella palustris TaxID=493376 RepID=UPI0012EBFA18|nr:META domain-containing protein [Kaistella palustris]
MNKLLLSLIGIVALLFLTNCTTQSASTPQNIQRKWMLVEFQNFTKEEMTAAKAHINLSPIENTPGRYSAHMGCNSMFFEATFDTDQTVKFSQVGSTMMYCDRNMDLEAAFGKALPRMTSYEVKGHDLILSDGAGNTMKFVAEDWD